MYYYCRELTKDYLEKNLGVEKVYTGKAWFGKIKVRGTIRKAYQDKNTGYWLFGLYDPELYKMDQCGQVSVGLHRLVWAWFSPDHKCRNGYEIDHINNCHEKLEDNRIENLQELTPGDNLAKERKSDENSSIPMPKKKKYTLEYLLEKVDYFKEAYSKAKENHDADMAHKTRSSLSAWRKKLAKFKAGKTNE